MPENSPQKKSYAYESARVMSVAFELGFSIALPIVALALAGKWLDTKYRVGYYVYLGIALAIILTSVWVYKRFSDMIETLKDASTHKETK